MISANADQIRHGGAQTRLLAIAVLAIFLVKLVLYLVVIPRYHDALWALWSIGPADNYATISKYINLGLGYRFSPETALTLEREPGYPYFLALLRWAFEDGYREAAIVANIVFTSISAFLIGALARSVTSLRRVALIAPLLFLLHPGTIGTELRLGVEVPFILLLLGFFLTLRHALCSGTLMAYLGAGLLLGAASCVRSTALLYPFFLVPLALLFRGGWSSLLRSAVSAAIVLIGALLVLSPWIIRNYGLVHRFIPTASVQGVSMQVGDYICSHGDSGLNLGDLDLAAADARNSLAADQGYRFKPAYYQMFYDPQDEIKFNDSLARQVVQHYRDSPALFARCTTKNLLNFWFAGKTPRSTLVNVCVQLPFMLLALAGVFIEWRRLDRVTLAMLLLFVFYTMCVYAPIHALARYSVPLVPILAILAAIPICRWTSRGSADRSAEIRQSEPRFGAAPLPSTRAQTR
jgi:4-amino-4-deoxy-L-arabinose transferase-like glycosyltransferase